MKNLVSAIKEVYKRPKYIAITTLVALAFIAFNIGIVNYRLFLGFPSFAVAKAVFLGTFSALPVRSVFFIILSAILTGVMVSMLFFHLNVLKGSGSSAAGGGMVLAVLAPACPSCGVGLIAALGGAGIVGSLPYAGLEITILAVILLAVVINSLANKIVKKTCDIKQ